MIATDDILKVHRFTHTRPLHLVVLKLRGLTLADENHTYHRFDGRKIRQTKKRDGWQPFGPMKGYEIDETGHITGFNGPAVTVGTWE